MARVLTLAVPVDYDGKHEECSPLKAVEDIVLISYASRNDVIEVINIAHTMAHRTVQAVIVDRAGLELAAEWVSTFDGFCSK